MQTACIVVAFYIAILDNTKTHKFQGVTSGQRLEIPFWPGMADERPGTPNVQKELEITP